MGFNYVLTAITSGAHAGTLYPPASDVFRKPMEADPPGGDLSKYQPENSL